MPESQDQVVTLPRDNREQQIAELKSKHQELDNRLLVLDGQISLTTEEQVERKRIQKLKLYCKDQIALLQTKG